MSLAGQIADAAVAAIQALNLQLANGKNLAAGSVVRLKAPDLPAGKDPPRIVVVVGEEGETEPLSVTWKLKRWQVAVVIITAGGTQLGDDDTVRSWREQIDAAIYDKQQAAFAGVPGWNVTQAAGKSPFDPAALSKDLNYSTLNYTVETIQTSDTSMPRTVTTYRHLTPLGVLLQQFAGISLTRSGATITIAQTALDGTIPAIGDEIRDTDGTRWKVTGVSPSGTDYQLTCQELS